MSQTVAVTCKHKNKQVNIHRTRHMPVEFHAKILELRSWGAIRQFILSEKAKDPNLLPEMVEICHDCREILKKEDV